MKLGQNNSQIVDQHPHDKMVFVRVELKHILGHRKENVLVHIVQ